MAAMSAPVKASPDGEKASPDGEMAATGTAHDPATVMAVVAVSPDAPVATMECVPSEVPVGNVRLTESAPVASVVAVRRTFDVPSRVRVTVSEGWNPDRVTVTAPHGSMEEVPVEIVGTGPIG
jgi:hypothetical protein